MDQCDEQQFRNMEPRMSVVKMMAFDGGRWSIYGRPNKRLYKRYEEMVSITGAKKILKLLGYVSMRKDYEAVTSYVHVCGK